MGAAQGEVRSEGSLLTNYFGYFPLYRNVQILAALTL